MQDLEVFGNFSGLLRLNLISSMIRGIKFTVSGRYELRILVFAQNFGGILGRFLRLHTTLLDKKRLLPPNCKTKKRNAKGNSKIVAFICNFAEIAIEIPVSVP